MECGGGGFLLEKQRPARPSQLLGKEINTIIMRYRKVLIYVAFPMESICNFKCPLLPKHKQLTSIRSHTAEGLCPLRGESYML